MSTELNKDRVVNVWRFNIPQIITTLIAAGGTIVTIVWYVGAIKTDITVNTNDVKYLQNYVRNREAYVDTQLTAIGSQLKDMSNIPYRVTTNEAHIDAVGKRIDSMTSQISTSVEGIRKDLSDLGTKVEVQSNKIDTLSKKVDRLSDGKILYTPTYSYSYLHKNAQVQARGSTGLTTSAMNQLTSVTEH